MYKHIYIFEPYSLNMYGRNFYIFILQDIMYKIPVNVFKLLNVLV